MINKIICILLLVLYLLLIYKVYQEIKKKKFSNIESFQLFKINNHKNIEHFEEDKVNNWTDSKEDIDAKTKRLNKYQKEEVVNMINAKVKQEMIDHSANNPSGDASNNSQPGEMGPQGPPGGEYLASGLLINKAHSLGENNEIEKSITRLHGAGNSGKVFLELKDNFSSTTYWYLDKDGHLKNRFDDTCLTTNGKNDSDLFMQNCENNENQVWEWNNKTNRLILKKSNSSANQQCVGLTKPKTDENTLLSDCPNNKCGNRNKRYLTLKKCGISAKDDEVWSFT